MIGEQAQNRNRCEQVGVEDSPGLSKIILRQGLVSEIPEAQNSAEERVLGRAAALLEKSFVGVERQGVESLSLRPDTVAQPKIRGEGLELLGVAAREQEVVASPGELSRHGPRDGRAGPENQDGLALPRFLACHDGTMPTRRAKEEESLFFGSSRALIARNSSSLGYMAAKLSAVVTASLAM